MEGKHLRWYCILSAPQKEHITGKVLRDLGHEVFVPVEIRFLRRKGKRYTREYPLLGPRYMFIGCKQGFPWEDFREIHMITDYVKNDDGPAIFDERLIKRLDRINKLPYNSIYRATPSSFREGEHVRIKSGPLSEHLGLVVDVTNKKLIVLVEILGSAKAIQLDWNSVEHI